jgi:7-alpha-hydroxysteroid dehydrogenase
MESTSELEGRVAWVTGGGSGIGRGIARRFLAAGCHVVITGRSADRLAQTAAELGGERVLPMPGDVGDETDVARIASEIETRFGRLDIGVNAAGAGSGGGLLDQTAESWSATLRTNLDGVMFCIKHQAGAMVRAGRGGSIVNLSSIAGILTHRWMSAYCVSKAGVEMLTRCAADELGTHGIRVNGLRPGLVPTELADPLVQHDKLREDYQSRMPLGRLGTVEDIAEATFFLVGDGATWITGQVFGVDGGHTLRGGPNIDLLFES